MTDTGSSARDVVKELEWQRGVQLPREFRDAHIPGYFRERGGRIRVGLSLRTRRRSLHPDLSAGIVYYPIGVQYAYTGNQVSISAPFEMDSDRSQIVDPLNSAFNAWLSESKPASDFDILSVDEDGGELFIEVKATSGRDGRFQWSRSEFERALQERGRYILYRVYQAEARSPVVRSFRDPIALLSQGGLRLDIETLRAEVEPSVVDAR